MPTTELAILHLTTPTPLEESNPLLTTLASATPIQDAWHQAHFPHLPSSAADRAAVWFAQVEDPSRILTTARWESTAAHWEWIRSDANKGVMASLEAGGGIVPEDTVLLHVKGDLFGGHEGDSSSSSLSGGGLVPLLESPVISVARMFVARGNREAFAAKFRGVRGVLKRHAHPHLVRAGWREDVPEGAEEDEFVLVCGWESVERHFAFAEAPEFPKYNEIRELITRVDLKHYKRLLLE